MSKNIKATIKDVACRAGVSSMTVSRVVRQPSKVAAATRARVEQVIAELGYVPDLIAGALSSQRSGLVVVLLPSLRHTGFATTVSRLAEEVEAYGYHVLLGDTSYSVQSETKLVRKILGRRPEGVVFISSLRSSDARQLLQRAQIPVVETWDNPRQPIDMVVGFSHRDCGYALTRSLIEAGYRQIGFIGGHAGSDPRGEQRRQGHLAALRDAGLSEHLMVTTNSKPFNISDGCHGVVQLIEQYPEVEAIHCMTDIVAFGALSECQRRGWPVPERVAINGFGNFDISSHLVPALTTVGIDAQRIGQLAAKMLLQRINGLELEQTLIDVGFQVITRASSHPKPVMK